MSGKLNFWIEKITAKNSKVFLFLFCITILVYGNILFGGFVFDDNIFIENNVQIRSPANVGLIYQSSTTAGSGLTGDNFYRPNQQLIYTVLYSFFGLTPFFFHLVPILFHILNGFLIFLLFTRLGISRRSALFGSMLFLLHPILTQAVSYISGLSEPLVASTILLTLLIFLEAIKENPQKKFLKWLGLGALVFTIGLFSKESQSVSLGPLVLLGIFQYKKGELYSITRAGIFTTALAGLSILYFCIRIKFLNFTGTIGLTSGLVSEYTESLWVRITTFIHIFPEYFKMMLWPYHLYYEKPYEAFASLVSLKSFTGLFLIVAGIAASLISLLKKNGRIFFGLLWFGIALVPVTGLVPLNAMYLEHWLYLPIIGVIFCLCLLFEKISHSKYFLPVFILILILFSVRVFARNMEWGNPIKFYENELKYTQTSARIYNDLAMEQSERLGCDVAIPNYEKAISISDSYPQTHHNLARCFERTGRLEEAVAEYLKALRIEPNFSYSINALRELEARGIIEIQK
ncbi:MAG TPA: tetratricopeptide repeat protein [Candidatus Paceibacterota bacterium]